MNDFIGKIPPQAVDVEEVVLGACMLESGSIERVADFLTPSHFYKEAHSRIWECCLELFNENQPIDILTVTQRLKKKEMLEIAGGAYYVSTLTNKVNSSANLEAHAKILIEHAIKRHLIEISTEMSRRAYDDTEDAFEMISDASVFLSSLENMTTKDARVMKQAYKDYLLKLEKIQNQEISVIGIPCGYTAIDRVTGGWQDGDLIIIASRPGMGKSSLVLSMLRNICQDFEIPAVLFSLEMSEEQLVGRMVSMESGIPTDQLRAAKIDDWDGLLKRTAKLTDAPLYLDDTAGISSVQLRAKCRRLVSRHGVRLIVVDYLQLMKPDKKTQSREQEIAQISSSLKAIAKELNIPIIAVSQLSRAVEQRTDRRPLLSDLRESGAIEQDADLVIFLYRDEYYGIDFDENGISTKGLAEVLVEKHRNGKTGRLKLGFKGELTKFVDYNDLTEAEEPPF